MTIIKGDKIRVRSNFDPADPEFSDIAYEDYTGTVQEISLDLFEGSTEIEVREEIEGKPAKHHLFTYYFNDRTEPGYIIESV